MSSTPGGSRPRVADRLATARHRRFVGRAAELALFGSALGDEQPPFALLYVHGPGGVGKTVLLGEFARLADDAGTPVVRLDGRDLDPSPPGVLTAVGRALGDPSDRSSLETLAEWPRGVLLVDTYETLAPLDPWFRPEESQAYLSARGVPVAQHPAVLSFTHGHPLALSLVADVSATGGDPTALALEQRPDVVRALLERFVQGLPSARHRQALEACAHVRVTTEALLASALEAEDAHELFGWLRRLSFIEEGPHGLFPHDLAREVLDADLRWRNPESYLELHQGVRRFIVGHLRQARGRERQQAFFDLLYLHRNNPIMRASTDWETLGTAHVEPATRQDRQAVLAMVHRNEAEASARIAEHWVAAAAGGVRRVPQHRRGAGRLHRRPRPAPGQPGRPGGGPGRGGGPPLRRPARPRPPRRGADPSPLLDGRRHLPGGRVGLEPDGRDHVLGVADQPAAGLELRDHGGPGGLAPYLDLSQPAPGRRSRVRGGRSALWRVRPRLAGRAAAGLARPHGRAGTPHRPTDGPPGGRAARAAGGPLRTRVPGGGPAGAARPHPPGCPGHQPLLRSRLATQEGSGAPTPATLERLLREAAEPLRANPRDERLYRALACTFFEPAATQELAAERLGLPFSTYRYHLAGGIRRVTEQLWRRELYGAED